MEDYNNQNGPPRYKGVMSRVRGDIKAINKSKRFRSVGEITSNRLQRELARLGFSKEKQFALQQKFNTLDNLRYMNAKTLAVTLLLYDQHTNELAISVDSKSGQINMNTLAYNSIFNGQTISRYTDLLYPTPDKLIKRKIVTNQDKELLVTKIKGDLLRYLLEIAQFLGGV